MTGSGGEKPVVKCMLCQISEVVAAYRASLLGLRGVCSQVKRTTALPTIHRLCTGVVPLILYGYIGSSITYSNSIWSLKTQ